MSNVAAPLLFRTLANGTRGRETLRGTRYCDTEDHKLTQKQPYFDWLEPMFRRGDVIGKDGTCNGQIYMYYLTRSLWNDLSFGTAPRG